VATLVAAERMEAIRLSDAIADLAEPGFKEDESSRLLSQYLSARGFAVEFPWKPMPTAFKATWGRGKPSIGLLAEYDALPNCGPRESDYGHGCGHNLLGVGAAVGAVAAAGMLRQAGLDGQIVLWGCPAEELVAGKVYMARDGAFRCNDAILGWHPGGANAVGRSGHAAIDSMLFEFFGRTAHGSHAHNGRSALDGVILLDVAANYLREHIPENVRIHMCIRHGGDAPNVVPAYAKAWYYVRGKDRQQVDDVRRRLVKCARGAALATETKVQAKRLTGCYHRLRNEILGDLVEANFKLFGPLTVTAEDRKRVRQAGKKPEFAAGLPAGPESQSRGSSDEDNVSWLAPFTRFSVACVSKGTAAHHRDYAAQVKWPFAHRGMLRAAEILGVTAFELCADAALLARARDEFRKGTRGFVYDPLVTPKQKPPAECP